eukprot:3566656-Amphidinium_carterae.1
MGKEFGEAGVRGIEALIPLHRVGLRKGDALNARPEELTESWVATVMAQLTGALTCAHDVVG